MQFTVGNDSDQSGGLVTCSIKPSTVDFACSYFNIHSTWLRPIQRFDDLFGEMRQSPSDSDRDAKTIPYQSVRF
jgi:hypothetical protein